MILWWYLHLSLSASVMFGDVLWQTPQTDMPVPTDSRCDAVACSVWWCQALEWVCDLVFLFLFFFFVLQRQNPKDVHTLAQLISAYSLVDPEKAKVYPFDSGICGIWALFPWILLVWEIQSHSHVKDKEHLHLHIQLKFSGAALFSSWFDWYEIPGHFYLWPLPLSDLVI